MAFKGVDTDISITNIIATTTTNGDIIPLNLIQQGTASWNRTGRRIQTLNIRCKGVLSSSHTVLANGNLQSNNVKLMIVYDKQPSGILPTFDTIFGTTNQNGSINTTYFSPVKYTQTNRFKVLKEAIFNFNPTNSAGATANDLVVMNQDFEIFVPITEADQDTLYNGQSSPMTIADISSGGFYLIARSLISDPAISTVSITQASFGRVRYMDK